jgi:hypothetical protein
MRSRSQPIDIGQLSVELENDALPLKGLLSNDNSRTIRRRGCGRRCVVEHNLGPARKDLVCDVEFPVHSQEEGNLVLVDLECGETRDLAPGARRIVAILKILRGKDQGG